MRRNLALCGLIGAATFTPATEPPPKAIYGVYAASGKAAGRDSIRVTPKSGGKAGLALKLYYANGHTCQMEKEGEWQGNHLLIAAEGLRENEPCVLQVFCPQRR